MAFEISFSVSLSFGHSKDLRICPEESFLNIKWLKKNRIYYSSFIELFVLI
jgi:hypothetical protein